MTRHVLVVLLVIVLLVLQACGTIPNKISKWAEKGDAYSQYCLGAMYDSGDRVPKDMEQAIYWYRKAAAQGQVDGEVALGLCYLVGRGVPMNEVEAYIWFKRAAAKNHPDYFGSTRLEPPQAAVDATTYLGMLEKTMAAAQIAEAEDKLFRAK